MTFEEWMQKNNYSLSGIDEQEAEFLMKEAWNYQQERIDELEHKLALRDAFIAGMQFMETERLREKKKQIYKDLEDAVDEEWGSNNG